MSMSGAGQPKASNAPRRVLLLSGASRGIGHATVKRFSAAGWRVITISRQPFPEQCPWEMGPEDHIQLDLTDQAATEAAAEEIKQRLKPEGGRARRAGQQRGDLAKGADGARLGSLEMDIDGWLRVFRVNFFAPLILARGLVEPLQKAKGSVVNVTSIAGSRVHPFAGVAYSTSKSALAGLTREMATDFAPLGIRVNAISPGRDRHLHPLAGHREDRAGTDPDAPPRPAGRGRAGDLLPVHRGVVLRERRRTAHQWRAACVIVPSNGGRSVFFLTLKRRAPRIRAACLRACAGASGGESGLGAVAPCAPGFGGALGREGSAFARPGRFVGG